LSGTPCARKAIAIGATTKPACILSAISASLISGKPWKRRGTKSSPASVKLLM